MKRKVISVFLAGIMLLGFTTTVMADSLQDLQDQASDINATIKEQESRRDEIKEERATALDEIESIENSIGKYEVEIENLESEISSLESDIEKKKEEIKQLEEDYKQKDKQLQEKLVFAQKYGQISYLDVLLGSDNFMDFISNAHIVSELTEADNQMMEEIEKSQKQIEKVKKELESEKSELDTSKKSVEAKQKQLAVNKQAKEEKVASLSAEDKKVQAELEDYKTKLRQIDAEIKKKEEEANKNGIYTGSFSGTLGWPISTSSPNYNAITSYFGNRESPVPGASTYHRGIDIGVSTGTPVYSSADGYVLDVQYTGVRGLFVLIKHGNNLYTRYQHLSSPNVSAGQYVKRGQQIARSGNSGIGSGPHLHFEVLTRPYYGYEVNPLNYAHW
ncbi:MAG: peptidoglycan DD-metalloendopeptidase family protein [Clostridia bacterium]|nr:peptidoglycan DD-metalloendopeptidase family protein [Clostridia bacterium]